MSDPANADQITFWNDKAGSTWTAFQARIDATFGPITAAALEAAAPQPGEQVIDVGCGCGETVLALARRVGPAGSVLGADISRPMLARAGERIREAGLTNAKVVEADAMTHRFPPAVADLVFSRFGVMFFADPVAAFGNLRQAVRPSGRLLFAAWRAMTDNPFFTVPFEAGRSLLPPQPDADPTAPGPFAFADGQRVEHILRAAGWRNIRLVRHEVPLRIAAPGQFHRAIEFATRVGALARAMGETDDETRVGVARAVGQALKPYDGPSGVVLGGSVWLVSASA